MLVPDLFGGDGVFHQPTYFNSYNLPEVVGYVGLLPLAAALALLTRSFGRDRDPRRPTGRLVGSGRRGDVVDLRLLHLVRGALRAHPVLRQGAPAEPQPGPGRPLVGRPPRLWADRLLAGPAEGAGLSGRRRWVPAPGRRRPVLLCLRPWPPRPAGAGLELPGGRVDVGRGLTPWFPGELVVAVEQPGGGGWPAITHRPRTGSMPAVGRSTWGYLAASTSVGLADGHAPLEPTTAVAVLGARGASPSTTRRLSTWRPQPRVGEPDLDAFTKLPSVLGYGSITPRRLRATPPAPTTSTPSPTRARWPRGLSPLRLASFLTLPRVRGSRAPARRRDPRAPGRLPRRPAGDAGRRILYLGWAPSLSAEVRVRPGTPATAHGRPDPGVGILPLPTAPPAGRPTASCGDGVTAGRCASPGRSARPQPGGPQASQA